MSDYTLSDAMRDLAPHLIRREARASTRLDDCTQNEEEPMSKRPFMITDAERRLRAELTAALAEKDRAIAQSAACVEMHSNIYKILDWVCADEELREQCALETGLVVIVIRDKQSAALAALPAEAERLLKIRNAAFRWHTSEISLLEFTLVIQAHYRAMGTAVSGEGEK